MLGEATGLRKVYPTEFWWVEIGKRGEQTGRRRGRGEAAGPIIQNEHSFL